MNQNKRVISGILLAIIMLLLILDSKTALQGAQDGIWLCISVVAPSLFPFVFLSIMLSSRLVGSQMKGLNWLCRLCGIPLGSESLLILSFLSGYPIGAAMVSDAYRQGCISRTTAYRMLGFCNNAGPAFLFGMVGRLFSDSKVIWVIWLIHILSALLVGFLLPDKTNDICIIDRKSSVSTPEALETSLKTMVNICGWVIFFRVILLILEHWLFFLFPEEIKVGLWGVIELSNGITSLHQIQNPGARFVFCSGILAFGGVCVLMQTISVTKGIGTGQYFPGKVLQCLFSVLISSLLQPVLFRFNECTYFPPVFYILLISGILIVLFFMLKKKVVAYQR